MHLMNLWQIEVELIILASALHKSAASRHPDSVQDWDLEIQTTPQIPLNITICRWEFPCAVEKSTFWVYWGLLNSICMEDSFPKDKVIL